MTANDYGPFLILGVDKDADAATLAERCADRVESSRRGELRWTENELLAALEQLHTPSRRLVADAESYNPDIASGEVRRLARLFRVDGTPPGWEPMDPEPPAESADTTIDAASLAASLPAPDVPLELPSVETWLEKYAAAGNDPWTSELTG
ncbi:MAG: hypothetical protein K1X57_11145 [Gemmataceae bacterium]|nr:hypothetical protein [Gemmataceae bacterium]